MDAGLARAVRESFVRLWEEGLIYRDDCIVNWCPKLPDRPLGHRGRARGARRRVRLHQVRPGHPGHGAAGDEARRHRPRRASQGQALQAPRGQDARGAVGGRHDHGEGRRGRGGRSQVRHRRHQGDAGPRSGRLRDRAPPQPADQDRHRLRRANDGRRGPLRGDGPLRVSQADRRGHEGARPDREDRALSPRGRHLLSQQDRRRAARVETVVGAGQAPGRGGDQGGARATDHDLPAQLDEDLLPLDGEHPSLVHLAPALVGTPHSGVVLRRRRLRARVEGRPPGVPEVRGTGPAGSGHPRHVVLVRPLAVLDPRMARRHDRPPNLLSDLRARHGAATSCSSGSRGWRCSGSTS